MLEIEYRDLVMDHENTLKNLVQFCSLPWDEQCLQFYESGRHVRTASYNQVNKPIYKSSLDRWKNYSAFIGPLREVLGVRE